MAPTLLLLLEPPPASLEPLLVGVGEVVGLDDDIDEVEEWELEVVLLIVLVVLIMLIVLIVLGVPSGSPIPKSRQ